MATSTFEGRALAPGFRTARRSGRWLALGIAAVMLVGFVVVAWPRGDARPAGAVGRIDPTTYFDAAIIEFAAFDAGLWAWDQEGIGRYADGEWYGYPELPPGTRLADIAIRADGTVVLATSSGLLQLRGSAWQRVPEAPSELVAIEVDPVTGVEWWAIEGGLYRWDGSEAVRLPEPPVPGVRMADEMVVGADGSLWVGTNNVRSYFPEMGGLARYRGEAGSWDAVRPLGGFDDIPARVGRTADGGAWAMLVDWPEDWDRVPDAGERDARWWPARLDGDSQKWTVYDGLPNVHPFAMAVGADAIWFAQGHGTPAGFEDLDGVLRFDGEVWTRYLEDEYVTAVAVAGDGTVWVSTISQPGLAHLDTSPGAGHPAGYPTGTVPAAPRSDALVVALGDSLTGTWAEDYAHLLSEATGAAVAGLTFWRPGAVDLAALVRSYGDAVAGADVVLLEVDPYAVFRSCSGDRACRTRETEGYRGRLAALLDDIIRRRAGDRSGVAVVSMGFWGGDGLQGPDFHGSPGWDTALEDMAAWFAVVRAEASGRQIPIVDVNAELLGGDYRGRMPAELTTDGIHLSDEGNAEVGRILFERDDIFDVTP